MSEFIKYTASQNKRTNNKGWMDGWIDSKTSADIGWENWSPPPPPRSRAEGIVPSGEVSTSKNKKGQIEMLSSNQVLIVPSRLTGEAEAVYWASHWVCSPQLCSCA